MDRGTPMLKSVAGPWRDKESDFPKMGNRISTPRGTLEAMKAGRPPGTHRDRRVGGLHSTGFLSLNAARPFATGDLPFVEFKRRSHINKRARAADRDSAFSVRIREGLPGFPPAE
jgi:hypothetical protein